MLFSLLETQYEAEDAVSLQLRWFDFELIE